MGMSMQPKSSSSVKIYGFSLLRNGVKYDYSFKESLNSLHPLVSQIYLALDKGEDNSFEEIQKMYFVKIIESKWDLSLKDGEVLSSETNKALTALRQDHAEGWGIYLQADEVLHEDDYEILKKDINKAEREGFDAISFCYLHFWQTHHDLAIEKNWYPHEVRAIKLNSKIESWGDAQGFRKYNKILFTQARIYHYGHVRPKEVYEAKMHDMSAMYDKNGELSKYYNPKDRGKIFQCLKYFGNHPRVMKERILRMNDIWQLEEKEKVIIVGKSEKYSPELIKKIAAKKVVWCKSSKDPHAVITEPGLWDRLSKKTAVPKKMKSKHAHNWNNDFILTLQLSERGIGLKS